MRILSSASLAACALAATACASSSTTKAPEAKTYPYLMVETVPAGATLSFPDGLTCETPCAVNIKFEMLMTVAKAGYKPITYRLFDNTPGELVVEMELVAPTTAVEETSLPDL